MARWRLTASHYLLTDPPTKWEQVEVDRETGQQARKEYVVPRLLDVSNPRDHNSPDGIIVANKFDPANRRDVVFLGNPGPDMDPLDAEAEAISESLKHKWIHPIESLPENGLAQALMAELRKGQPLSATGVDPTAFAALQQQVLALIEQNAALIQKLEAKPEPVARRA